MSYNIRHNKLGSHQMFPLRQYYERCGRARYTFAVPVFLRLGSWDGE
jgi:hypothetical protein